MKIKRTYLFFLFAILLSVHVNGQDTGFYWVRLNETSNRLQGKMRGEYYYNSLIGNNYFFLHKEWYDANITLVDGDVFENVKVRYLAYGDELISYNENIRSYFYKIDKDIVKEFLLKEVLEGGKVVEHKFVKLFYDGLLKGDRYFEELYSGTRSLLVFHQIRGIKVRPFKDEAGIMRDTEYRMHKIYYIYSAYKGFSKIRNTRHSFLRNLPEYKKSIRKIFRQNRITLVDESSMIKAFMLLDEASLLN